MTYWLAHGGRKLWIDIIPKISSLVSLIKVKQHVAQTETIWTHNPMEVINHRGAEWVASVKHFDQHALCEKWVGPNFVGVLRRIEKELKCVSNCAEVDVVAGFALSSATKISGHT